MPKIYVTAVLLQVLTELHALRKHVSSDEGLQCLQTIQNAVLLRSKVWCMFM